MSAIFQAIVDGAPIHKLPQAEEVDYPDDMPDFDDESTGSGDLPFGSEQALADEFANRAVGYFRWTPGMDWMVNHGTHWHRDELMNRYQLAKDVCKWTAGKLNDAKLRAKLCAASTSNALLSLARTSTSMATPTDAWDAHPMLLNTPTGVVDLETGQTVQRDGLLFTQVTSVGPAAMPTPVWDKFLSDVFSNDVEMIEFIQRMGGYCLTGSIKEQKLFFFHGGGANGKSVLLDVLRNIAGRYSHNLPAEALMTSRHEGHPTMFASLHGKRLAISSEIEESAHWAESRIKSLTGDETLTARYMRQDFFTFAISHKHVIAGNFKPRLKGDDFAMVRRMVLIPFNRKFEGAERDDNLPHKLKREYQGIMAWFVEGARKWAQSGLAIPSSVTEASKAYLQENDDISLWVEACCDVEPGLRCKSSDLYQSFSGWKQAQGEHAASSKAFSQRLERVYRKQKMKDGMYFEGLRARFATFDEFPRDDSKGYRTASRGE